jgi:hypothetical protein
VTSTTAYKKLNLTKPHHHMPPRTPTEEAAFQEKQLETARLTLSAQDALAKYMAARGAF